MIELPLLFVLLVFAALRVTRMFTRDTIFNGPRHAWFRRFRPESRERREQANCEPGPAHKLGMLIECPWCIGFWCSGIVVATTAQFTSIPLPVLWWLAVASAQALIHGYEK